MGNDTHGDDSVRHDLLTYRLHLNPSAQPNVAYLIEKDVEHRAQNVWIPAGQMHGLRPLQLMTVKQS